jgi:hypothetical protein
MPAILIEGRMRKAAPIEWRSRREDRCTYREARRLGPLVLVHEKESAMTTTPMRPPNSVPHHSQEGRSRR